MLIVVGDFDLMQARKEIETRFAAVAKGKGPLPTRPQLTPGKRRVRWDVPKRHLVIAWQIPSAGQGDHPALYLAGQLLQERLYSSPDRSKLGTLPLVNSDFDRMLVIGCEAPNEESFDAARKWMLGEVARLCAPNGLDKMAVRSLSTQLDQFQKTDLNKVPLPAGITRTMARTNIELQRLAVEIVAGDFDKFLAKLNAVTPEAATAAVRKWLAADRACIVEVVPEDAGKQSGAEPKP